VKLIETELLVLGAGPGGYAAAFYGADKGMKVTLVEQEKRLGGVCLNRGCIPSKAFLHATRLIAEAGESDVRGITFGKPDVDLAKMRAWKESILNKLAGGIAGLAERRGVHVMQGRGYFEDSRTLRVETHEGQKFLHFKKAIIATGSQAAIPPAFDLGNPRIMTSTEALELEEIPARFLIVGGGYIGMELGTVYAVLGSEVTIVEALPSILSGADRVLVAVGRKPNSANLGLENTKVALDEKGFIKVDEHQETAEPDIFAIGDIAGGVLLAHKATKEARVAIEVMTGESSTFEHIVIPAVVFTDPEIAWCGLTEAEAREKGVRFEVAKFPWSASGRALSFDRTDGLTKLIVDPETERVLGVGIVGAGAGELVSEGVLAIEMGATAKDLAESVHPHPTLSETISECAESFYGYATHTYSRKPS
jgi:dihydrolipoamide dehydrogenase